jgi:transcriptional regulator with XRE-family HTH domain
MSNERTATAVDIELGRRTRARRLALGMSQERLAEILGVTFQQVQKYERGTNRIAASRLHDIARALDMPVAHFFEGLSIRRGEGQSAIDAALATKEGLAVAKAFASVKSRLYGAGRGLKTVLVEAKSGVRVLRIGLAICAERKARRSLQSARSGFIASTRASDAIGSILPFGRIGGLLASTEPVRYGVQGT